jgi:hypothetical protein
MTVRIEVAPCVRHPEEKHWCRLHDAFLPRNRRYCVLVLRSPGLKPFLKGAA